MWVRCVVLNDFRGLVTVAGSSRCVFTWTLAVEGFGLSKNCAWFHIFLFWCFSSGALLYFERATTNYVHTGVLACLVIEECTTTRCARSSEGVYILGRLFWRSLSSTVLKNRFRILLAFTLGNQRHTYIFPLNLSSILALLGDLALKYHSVGERVCLHRSLRCILCFF